MRFLGIRDFLYALIKNSYNNNKVACWFKIVIP